MRANPSSLRATLRHLRQASASREYVPPDPDDPVAVRKDDAGRVFRFLQVKREQEGYTGPTRYDTIRAVYAYMLRKDSERG